MAKKSDLPALGKYFPVARQCFVESGGSLTIEEMEEQVAKRMRLTEKLVSIPHGDGRRTQFQYELAWVRTYLKWAGVVTNSERGVWSLTPKGAAMSEAEIADVPRSIREQQRQKISAKEASVPADSAEIATELRDWKELLLSVLLAMKPDVFERLGQRLLRESGFTKVEVTGRAGDGGIDGTGVLRVNLLSFQVLFQCKRWKGAVGPSVVRDFRGAMVGRTDKGLIITTGTFTAEARREATRDGAPAIDLVDGDTLCDLLKSLKLGVTTRFIEDVSVNPNAFDNI